MSKDIDLDLGWIGDIVDWILNAAEDAFRWLDDAVSRLDAFEWAALILAALLAWRAWVAHRERNTLGPITVTDLEDPPPVSDAPTEPAGDAPPPETGLATAAVSNEPMNGKQLTALMRECLSSSDLKPDAQLVAGHKPAGFSAVVKESSVLPQAAWLSAIVSFVEPLLRRLTQFGFTAEGTLLRRSDAPPCGITIAFNRSWTRKLISMKTYWANTFPDAVELASCWLTIQAVDKDPAFRNKRPSSKWNDPDALLLFHKALVEEVSRPTDALATYKDSASLEEQNVLPRLAMANLYEQQAAELAGSSDLGKRIAARKPLVEALTLYERVAHFWPEEIEARYRLATMCSFREMWRAAWQENPCDDPDIERLEGLVGPIGDPPTGEGVGDALVGHGLKQYRCLIKSGKGTPAFKDMLDLACKCAELQTGETSAADLTSNVMDKVRGGGWEVKYAAACLFTLAIHYDRGGAVTRNYVKNALCLLDRVSQDPDNCLPVGWVAYHDPDLQPLRDWLVSDDAKALEHDADRAAWTAFFSKAQDEAYQKAGDGRPTRRVRWITFDCYGTLVDWRTGMESAAVRAAPYMAEALLSAYRRHELVLQAERPAHSYRHVLQEGLRRAAEELDIELTGPGDMAFVDAWPNMPVFSDVEVALANLRDAGWKLAILTNCDDKLIALTEDRLPADFDMVVTAEQVGSYKPDLGHLRTFRERSGVRQGNWIHVSSSWTHDILPATRLGIPGIWVDREGVGGPPGPTSAEIHDLTTLPATVAGLAANPAS